MRWLLALSCCFAILVAVGCGGTEPKLTPSPMPTEKSFFITVISPNSTRSQVLIVTPQAKPTPDEEVIIGEVFNSDEQEYVLIKNNSSVEQNMGGWYLFNPRTGLKFRFPDDFKLPVGGSVRVHSGLDGVDTPPTDFYWDVGYLWNDTGDDVILLNPAGRVMFWYTY